MNVRLALLCLLLASVTADATAFRTHLHGDRAQVTAAQRGSVPTTILITSLADPQVVSGTPLTVTGTTTGTITGVTWATACVAGPTACSTGPGSFSCTVTQTSGCASSQTITVSANASVTDTTVVSFPTFDLDRTTPVNGPTLLSDSLTINSTSMTLVASCLASQVSGTNWVCGTGGTLAEAGSSTSPAKSTSTPFYDGGSVITYAASAKRHEASSSALADITTEDFVIEYVGSPPASTATALIAHDTSAATATAGWYLEQAVGGVRLVMSDGSTEVTGGFGTSANGRGWQHIMCFVDASANATCAVDGGVIGTSVSVAGVGSMTSAAVFTIGGYSAAATTAEDVAEVRVWKCTDCLNTEAEWQTIATARAAIALGEVPGLALGATSPTAATRASQAYVDVGDASGLNRVLYQTDKGFIRTARRKEAVGADVVGGFLMEPQTTNLALQSETLGTTWTKSDAGDTVSANTTTAPNNELTADAIRSGSATAPHCISQAVTLTAATHTLSAWGKLGQKTFAYLGDDTVANTNTWFDLSACAAATTGAGATARVSKDFVNSWCRIGITFTGTAAAHTLKICVASADNTTDYAGDNDATDDAVFWGVEAEAMPTFTSYQPTVASASTRSADVLSYAGTSNVSVSGTLAIETLCPSFDTATTAKGGIFVDANNLVDLEINATNDRASTTSTVGGVAQWAVTSASGDVTDGERHEERVVYSANDVTLFYDGVSVGTDVSASMLASVASASLQVGHLNSASQSACLITRVRHWPVAALASVAPRRRGQPPRRRRRIRRPS